MPGQPEASVVISAYSGPAVTRRCLESIASALGPELGRRFELVLVDNGSVDDTGVLLDAWSDRARIVRLPENRNFAGGMNAGVHAAAGDVVVLLNTDMVVPSGTLERLVDAARDPSVAIAGARLLYPDGFHQHGGVIFRPIGGGLTGLSHLFQFEPGEIPAGRACYDVEALTGACMAVRRELFLGVGGFDEEYVNDLDDIDLSLRLRTRGLRLRYLGDVTIEHRESVTRTTYDQASHDRFHARWAAVLQPDDELLARTFSARLDPRANVGRMLPHEQGATLSVEGSVAGLSPEADEARALLVAFERAGLAVAAFEHAMPRALPFLPPETDRVLERARGRAKRPGATLVHVGRADGLRQTGAATVLRLAGVPRRARLAGAVAAWVPDRATADGLVAAGMGASAVHLLPPFLPELAEGPGGEGVLAVLPAHDLALAEATCRALARVARGLRLRVGWTVATGDLQALAARWLPDAELLPTALREPEVAALAGAADVVVALDGDDGFQRGLLLAAGAGAAVVGRRGAAGHVLGEALAAPGAADARAIGAALESALAAAAERSTRSRTVAAACSGGPWLDRLTELAAAVEPGRRRPASTRPAAVVFTDRPPEPAGDAGARRMLAIVRALQRLGVTPIVVSSESGLDDAPVRALEEDGVEVCLPDRIGFDYPGLLQREELALAVFESPEYADSARRVLAEWGPHLRRIVDVPTLRPRPGDEALAGLRGADGVLAPSAAAQDVLAEGLPGTPVGLFPPARDRAPALDGAAPPPVAVIRWVPGADPAGVAGALERLVPPLRALVSDAVVRLLGTPIPRELVRRALAVGVEVPGCLEDPHEALAAARAALVLVAEPLADSVLDAQAAGVPVVAPADVLAGLPDSGRRTPGRRRRQPGVRARRAPVGRRRLARRGGRGAHRGCGVRPDACRRGAARAPRLPRAASLTALTPRPARRRGARPGRSRGGSGPCRRSRSARSATRSPKRGSFQRIPRSCSGAYAWEAR